MKCLSVLALLVLAVALACDTTDTGPSQPKGLTPGGRPNMSFNPTNQARIGVVDNDPGLDSSTYAAADAGILANSGAGWARLSFYWDMLEPSEGSLDSTTLHNYDTAVNALRAKGLSIYATVEHSPFWADSNSTDGCPACFPLPGDKVAHYARIVGVLADRYAGKTGVWGVWNEPNAATDAYPAANPTSTYYAMVRAVHDTLHASSRTNEYVVAPDLAETSDNVSYLQSLVESVGSDIDFVSVHVYSTETATKAWIDTAVLGNALVNGNWPVWLTEYYDNQNDNESTQAYYVSAIMTTMFADTTHSRGGATWAKTFWFDLGDSPQELVDNIESSGPYLREGYTCLIWAAGGLSAKPGYCGPYY